MEYLTNRPHSTSFTHFISMFLLFFFLLRSFGIHTECKDPYSCFKNMAQAQDNYVMDNTLFNEKKWFFDYSKSGQPLICSQRVNIFSEFYNQAPIECSIAREIAEIPNDDTDEDNNQHKIDHKIKPGERCWVDGDGNIFCKDQTTLRMLRTTKPVRGKKNHGVTLASKKAQKGSR